MFIIIPGVSSLAKYCQQIAEPTSALKQQESNACPHCHAGTLVKNGFYHRKASRTNEDSIKLNPVPIQRYLCKSCKRSCSALPECIPPRRWYLWDIQSKVLSLFISGKSYRAIARLLLPTRSTIARWIKRFNSQWLLYADTLRQHLPAVCHSQKFKPFWATVLGQCSLASVMCHCHQAGIEIP